MSMIIDGISFGGKMMDNKIIFLKNMFKSIFK